MKNPALADIKAVSFDLDDTLWHCAPAIEAAENALYAWHQDVTPRVTHAHTKDSLQAYRHRIRAKHPELAGCVTASRKAGLRDLLADFDYPENLVDEGFTVFYKARSEVELYDGALEMLASLGRDYHLAAITNGNADLHAIGISDCFDHIYAADLSQPPKPAPDMFRQCLHDMDLPAHALLHIGDNPVADIAGGHNASVQTLWFNQYNEAWPDQLEAPHYEVHALSDIVALLQEDRTL